MFLPSYLTEGYLNLDPIWRQFLVCNITAVQLFGLKKILVLQFDFSPTGEGSESGLAANLEEAASNPKEEPAPKLFQLSEVRQRFKTIRNVTLWYKIISLMNCQKYMKDFKLIISMCQHDD